MHDSPDHLHDEIFAHRNCGRMSHDDVRSTNCTDLRKLSEHPPVTLAPVWLPVGTLQQQQKAQQQPDAKRPKLNGRQDKQQQQQQQQQQLPVPPLRFFIQSAREFASVYLPGRALELNCE